MPLEEQSSHRRVSTQEIERLKPIRSLLIGRSCTSSAIVQGKWLQRLMLPCMFCGQILRFPFEIRRSKKQHFCETALDGNSARAAFTQQLQYGGWCTAGRVQTRSRSVLGANASACVGNVDVWQQGRWAIALAGDWRLCACPASLQTICRKVAAAVLLISIRLHNSWLEREGH